MFKAKKEPLALNQMMSKGTIQALRGQLGEALPVHLIMAKQ
jgi:hypothetical protein